MKNTFIVISVLFSVLISHDVSSQTRPGFFGHHNFIGYTGDLVFFPGSLNHKLFVESMISRRGNIGVSFNFGNGGFELTDEDYINGRQLYTNIDGKRRNVIDMSGKFKQKKTGFEIYIRKFSKKNQMRNFGWNWSYKFGQIRYVTLMQDGFNILVVDTLDSRKTETYENSTNSRSVQKDYFVGFEFGKTYPFFNDRLTFSWSGSIRQFFRSSNYTHNSPITSYIDDRSYDNIVNSHLMNIDISIAYAF